MVTEKLPKTLEEAVRKALFNGMDFAEKDAETEINALKGMVITSDSIKEYMQKPKCENCKWYAEFEGVCCNGDSEHRADFTDKDFCCKEFEKVEGEIKSNER